MGVKISNLPAIVTPALSDIFPVVQSGITYKESFTQLTSLFATAGANSNITSLTGLTTPLSVLQGGTGTTTSTGTGSVVLNNAPNIIGVIDGSLAAAGSVGQIISSAVVDTTINVTSGAAANVTSIALTAGDWDVSAMAVFVPAATTTVDEVIAAISLTSATLPSTITPVITQPTSRFSSPGAPFTTAGRQVLDLTTATINVAVPTTVYLVIFSVFAVSTMTAGGMIRARRMR